MQYTITIQMPILKETKNVDLHSFRNKEHAKYYLLDTGPVLRVLLRLDAFFYTLEKKQLHVAIPRIVIEQVAEHLKKSFSQRKGEHASTYNIEQGMRNFLKLLDNEKVKKIFNPEGLSCLDKEKYEIFEEDAMIVYVLFEGNFKGVVTHDYRLKAKIPKEKEVLTVNDLLK